MPDAPSATPAYTLQIDYPDRLPRRQAVIDYIKQTRDGFLNVAKMPDARDHALRNGRHPTEYSSGVPPRGTQTVVFKMYQNVGGAHPPTCYKAFNWDQALRKEPITFDNRLFRPGTKPSPVIFPLVQTELEKQLGSTDRDRRPKPAWIRSNYQNFAITNDALIFFFGQGEMLPESAGALQVSVPRGPVDADDRLTAKRARSRTPGRRWSPSRRGGRGRPTPRPGSRWPPAADSC